MVPFKTVFLVFLLVFCFAPDHYATAENSCVPTMIDVEGPYYLPGAPSRSDIADPGEPGERITISGLVLDRDCATPVKGAKIEVWQTDASGKYYYRKEGYRLRGQLKSDSGGRYRFRSVMPGRYKIRSGFRPAHIHVKVSHPDYQTVTTQLYFRGDPYLWPKDACGTACRSDDPLRIIGLKGNNNREGIFTFILKPVLP